MIMEQTDAILGEPAAINTEMRKSEHSPFFFRYDYHIFHRRWKYQEKKNTSTICMYKTFQRLLLLPLLLWWFFVSIIKPNHFHKYCYLFFRSQSIAFFDLIILYSIFGLFVWVLHLNACGFQPDNSSRTPRPPSTHTKPTILCKCIGSSNLNQKLQFV